MTLPDAMKIVAALALDGLLAKGGEATDEQAKAIALIENFVAVRERGSDD